MKDGGPAFPRTGNDYQAGDNHKYHPGHEGMSLRDWFAGQALSWINSSPRYAQKTSLSVAHLAYEMADAMLKAREESNG